MSCYFLGGTTVIRKDKEKFRSARKIPPSGKPALRPKQTGRDLATRREFSTENSRRVAESRPVCVGLKGGFPPGEIFRPNRNFLLSYKHSDGTKQQSFEFEQ